MQGKILIPITTIAIMYLMGVSFLLATTAGGVASVGERATFSSPDENARADEAAPKFQCQPTLATPFVGCCLY